MRTIPSNTHGAGVGASVAKANAGPFAVPAGVKFRVGLRNFIPQIDAGTVTLPCCIRCFPVDLVQDENWVRTFKAVPRLKLPSIVFDSTTLFSPNVS